MNAIINDTIADTITDSFRKMGSIKLKNPKRKSHGELFVVNKPKFTQGGGDNLPREH